MSSIGGSSWGASVLHPAGKKGKGLLERLSASGARQRGDLDEQRLQGQALLHVELQVLARGEDEIDGAQDGLGGQRGGVLDQLLGGIGMDRLSWMAAGGHEQTVAIPGDQVVEG